MASHCLQWSWSDLTFPNSRLDPMYSLVLMLAMPKGSSGGGGSTKLPSRESTHLTDLELWNKTHLGAPCKGFSSASP